MSTDDAASQSTVTPTVLQYLRGLEPAIPLSPIRDKDTGLLKRMSNADIRRVCEQRGVLFNGESVQPFELVDFPVFSLVFYPKSPDKKSTLI